MNLRMRTAMLPVLTAAFAVGCGGESEEVKGPTGRLRGMVTIGGKPVPAGVGVCLQHAQSGRLFMSLTNDAGEYFINKPTSKIPTGRYEVSIAPPTEMEDRSEGAAERALDGPAGGKPAAPTAPPVKIPQKYRQPHESGLGFDLAVGDNERAFKLE